jgi:hypothetical protein
MLFKDKRNEIFVSKSFDANNLRNGKKIKKKKQRKKQKQK